ncbi:MAG: hypothetical protein ABI665_19505 [Vicinamibacterales bacterium]
MPSIVWGREPQEAYDEPYEYGAQEQFAREASRLLCQLYILLNSERHHYVAEDRSPKKATWLLAMDALDSLREGLAALQRKEHRIAGKLFRDVLESMDLAAYFGVRSDKSGKALAKWYRDEYVPHREYRDHFRTIHGEGAAERLATLYKKLSRFTHRSYGAVLEGYTLGQGSRLVHDRSDERLEGTGERSLRMLVPPQTIAAYYAAFAGFVTEYAEELAVLGLVDVELIREAFSSCLEIETVPRRFTPRSWILAHRSAQQDSNVK